MNRLEYLHTYGRLEFRCWAGDFGYIRENHHWNTIQPLVRAPVPFPLQLRDFLLIFPDPGHTAE